MTDPDDGDDTPTSLGEMPKAIGVDTVKTADLKANPHNPRRLFDREPMNMLKESISKVGILVPLTVYKAKGSDHYTILDGQRRWMCAQELGMREVPINEVGEPTVAQNIVTMFQIHKLRKDWELMPTALKLQVLMEELDEKRDKQLAALTGLDVAVVVRCKKLLWYDEKYQEQMLFPEPESRVKADFFIELYPIVTDKLVKKADGFKKGRTIDRMLDKYQNKGSGIKAITDFRIIKQHLTAAAKANKVTRIQKKFQEFLDDDTLQIDHLEINAAAVQKKSKVLTRTVTRLTEELAEIDAMDFYGEEQLWLALERLRDTIKEKLKEADRREPQKRKG
ncbi:MAG: ParB N-terminal domain-containing protein [Ferrovibrio sp.]|uniref:ParB/RepB/Spo0J family partition protein n=1 Tax=Ferrovibrio sp. TaxID=1917215 RepID=UPI00262A25A5|nr:ParB N-terminal domain-containing protein [Ferrovibrio sp.]MCW0234259.1 ParB N-terminal domain-containing protein [Ferrovibrio sp.]